jgi:hypothetical protein
MSKNTSARTPEVDVGPTNDATSFSRRADDFVFMGLRVGSEFLRRLALKLE